MTNRVGGVPEEGGGATGLPPRRGTCVSPGRWVRLLGALLLLPLLGACPDFEVTSCVASGTRIATPTGEVAVETLRVGDVVWSVDPRSGGLHATRILAMRSARRPCLALTTTSGRTLVATAEHPLLDPATRRYREAGAWAAGETVAVRAGGWQGEAVGASAALPGRRTVWDLTVGPPFHNFVAGGFVAHNKSPPARTTLGPIQDFLEVREALTLAPAVPVALTTNFSDLGLAVTLLADPLVVGPGVVRVSAAQPFDAVVVQADTDAEFLDGTLELTLPAPATTVDLLVTLKGGLASVILTVGARVGAVIGPASFVTLPP